MTWLSTWGEVPGEHCCLPLEEEPHGRRNKSMLVALLSWFVGCTRVWGVPGFFLWGRSLCLCQPLTIIQLEAPSSQWGDSLETKTQPTDSQELVTAIHSWSSVAI